MSVWITGTAGTLEDLSHQVDQALQDIENMAKAGNVSDRIQSAGRSQFFTDNGVLKFYNSTDKTITTAGATALLGYVSAGIVDASISQLFTDSGVLKFYNSTDETIKTVTLI